jgi:hypothetical protein
VLSPLKSLELNSSFDRSYNSQVDLNVDIILEEEYSADIPMNSILGFDYNEGLNGAYGYTNFTPHAQILHNFSRNQDLHDTIHEQTIKVNQINHVNLNTNTDTYSRNISSDSYLKENNPNYHRGQNFDQQ